MDRSMDRQMDKQMYEWTNGWTSGWTDKWINRLMNHPILNSLLDVIMYLKKLLIILETQLMFMVSELYVRYFIMSLLFKVDFESKYRDDYSFDMINSQ